MIKSISIGIDPGNSSGGIAAVETNETGNHNCHTYRMDKMTDRDIANFFEGTRKLMERGIRVHAVIEKVHAVFGSSPSAMFSFGGNFSAIQMSMICNKIPFEIVQPAKWMSEFSMKKNKGEGKPEWKLRLRQKAEQIFPDAKIETNTADAILIGEYCRRKFNN